MFLGNTIKRSSFSSSSVSQKPIQKENLPPRRERTKSISEQNLEEIVKPKTSCKCLYLLYLTNYSLPVFIISSLTPHCCLVIRSWKLKGKPSGFQRPAPHDPVKLYHHYQSLWAKRKCPGEDSRADLRWLIREKMLGQNPHLYSRSVRVISVLMFYKIKFIFMNPFLLLVGFYKEKRKMISKRKFIRTSFTIFPLTKLCLTAAQVFFPIFMPTYSMKTSDFSILQ